MKLNDLYWLAGLLEGEGTFIWHGGYLCIDLCMTDYDVVHRARSLFSYGHNVTTLTPRTPSNLAAYRWRMSGRGAVGLMLTLYPLMGERRQRKIHQLIAEWLNPQDSHHYVNSIHRERRLESLKRSKALTSS